MALGRAHAALHLEAGPILHEANRMKFQWLIIQRARNESQNNLSLKIWHYKKKSKQNKLVPQGLEIVGLFE
jgi:hypothetical protein